MTPVPPCLTPCLTPYVFTPLIPPEGEAQHLTPSEGYWPGGNQSDRAGRTSMKAHEG
jgi:hypothetical protein